MLAQKSGVPYTTIVGLYERGADNARLSTLNRICTCFNVSLDYLVYDQYDVPDDFAPNGNRAMVSCETNDEIELISLFRAVNSEARQTLLNTARVFAGNPSVQKDSGQSETA